MEKTGVFSSKMIKLFNIHFFNLHSFTLSANLREHRVCPKSEALGEMFTNIRVLLSPSKYLCNRCVNFELRKGMWPYFFPIAEMTTPSCVSDLFMA